MRQALRGVLLSCGVCVCSRFHRSRLCRKFRGGFSAARQRARALAADLRGEADAATGDLAARIGAVTATERAAATRHAAVNFAVELLIRLLVGGVDISEHRQVAT